MRGKRKRAGRPPAGARIDLHGMTRAEAVAALESALDRALLDSQSRLEVIHGIGTGAVRSAVHDYLSSSRHVEKFYIDPFNHGTTIVIL